ncbi:hypothetical protein D9619_010165 [Psilocybe cf. subviscida]|uniref:NACHT domain-containing protein n=1 Tax=Psilocybe cf. subviscida TaxID=2480587 RepID=A0A8H5ASC0_9AGAR|nr:hypothetical protein D9619_010165 [Psilocybe cf. subviscida]
MTSAFTNANDVRIKNSSLTITTNVHTTSNPLEVLYKRVAPYAISNEGGRADNPKCHPGTREEVIGLLEKWMNAVESDRILWLSGPAGGGKTAIVKTLTERFTDRGIRTVNFYFFRGDSTRNGAQPLVPTLLYQLFELCSPSLEEAVAGILSRRPHIMDGSLSEQCKFLSMLSPTIRQSLPAGSPVLILVDGLDECDVNAELSQPDLIRALASLVMEEDSPFRLLVASRPEARIRMAFNRLSSPAQTIFLNEEYSPENDIRVFVTAEFDEIKASHPSAHLLKGNWPLPLEVEEIVHKSSGQFIYAATVMRYISRPSTVPSLSLQQVQGVMPAGKNSPLTYLDSVYTFILAQADNPAVMREVLSITLLPEIDSEHARLLHHYGNSRNSQALIESCISQLSAIVQLTGGENIIFYHASLADFLVDPERSGIYWVDVAAFRVKLLIGLWQAPSDIISYLHNTQWQLFSRVQMPNHDITSMLLHLPLPRWVTSEDLDLSDRKMMQSAMFNTVHRQYDGVDSNTSRRIIQRLQDHPKWLLESLPSTPFTEENNTPPTETNDMHPTKPNNTPPTIANKIPRAKVQILSFNWWCKILCINPT